MVDDDESIEKRQQAIREELRRIERSMKRTRYLSILLGGVIGFMIAHGYHRIMGLLSP